MEDLIVLGVCTDLSPQMNNWKKSLENNNYKYEILGFNEKWGGWGWRTQKYIEKLKILKKETIVILSDVTDVLFIKDSKIFYENFINNKDKDKVIIGAEPACCTGEFTKKRNYAIRKTKEKSNSRYRFPNGGILIGKAEKLLDLLLTNKDEDDDQAGYLKKWIDGDERITLDIEQKLTGNIPNMNEGVRVDDDEKIEEIDHWFFERDKIINITTKAEPYIIHFPGKNWKDYNLIGKQLVYDFEEILNDNSTPQKNLLRNIYILFACIIGLIICIVILFILIFLIIYY